MQCPSGDEIIHTNGEDLIRRPRARPRPRPSPAPPAEDPGRSGSRIPDFPVTPLEFSTLDPTLRPWDATSNRDPADLLGCSADPAPGTARATDQKIVEAS